jgi:hypothetical protein
MGQEQFLPHPVWQKEFAEKPFWEPKALAGRAKTLTKGFAPFSVSQMTARGRFEPLGVAFPISKGMTTYSARMLFKQGIEQGDKDYVKKVFTAALENNLDAMQLFESSLREIEGDEAKGNRKIAYKILKDIRKLGKSKRRERLEELKKKGTVTPEIVEQIIKILQREQRVEKQKKALRGLKK